MSHAPNTFRRGLIAAAMAAPAAMSVPSKVGAQPRWKPERPIVVYNPFAAGGVTDLHLRFLAEKVGRILGQQVLVEIKAGAGGTLAPAALLSARADGHVLACMGINSLRYPHYQQVPWNPIRDFTYITGLSGYTLGVVVRADAPWRSIEDLIAAGRADPEKLTYGTSGAGGTGQLLMIEVEQVTGAKFTTVPFKGGAEWMQALLAGHIDFVADAAVWAPFVDRGQCRILAMATEERMPKYPNAPTLRERGIDAVGYSVYGIVAPKDTPAAIVQSLHDAFIEATDDPGLQPLLDRFIQVPWRKNPAEFRAFAEQYFNGIRPLLIRAGLARS